MALIAGSAFAQTPATSGARLASNIVVPHCRCYPIPPPIHPPWPPRPWPIVPPRPELGPAQITGVDVKIEIIEQVATTIMRINLKNTGNRRQEAELIMPVPDGAIVRGFTFQGAGKEPSAVILPKAEAKKLYRDIVARVRDPALLEFIGYNMVRSSVFPVEAHGTQKVRLIYEELLPADGDRVDYVIARTESLEFSVPWRISVSIRP